MKKQILTAALLSLLSAGLTAAELTVAATPVPHGDILRLVAPDLKAQGYDLKVVEFSDFVSPNIALDAKEVTANYYQHKPFWMTPSRVEASRSPPLHRFTFCRWPHTPNASSR